MIEEILHGLDRNGEAETFPERDLHVGDADDFAAQVEQRPAAVAGVDLRGGLQIQLALHHARLGADDSFGDGAFQSQRTADGEHALAHRQRVGVTEQDTREAFNANIRSLSSHNKVSSAPCLINVPV